METILIIAGIAVVHLLATMSPGPSLLVAARTAIATSRGAGVRVGLGIAVGSVIWATGTMFGLAALFTVLPWLYTIMRVAGAAFLLYMAFMLWRHANRPLAIDPDGATAGGFVAAFRLGLFTQLANPKVAVYFGSVFLTLLPPDASVALYGGLLPLLFGIELAWFLFVAYACSVRPMREGYLRLKAAIDRVTGVFLAGLGLKLVLDR